jgi:predicted ATPase
LEAFGRAVDRIRTLKVLLLVTFRLDFDAPWVGRPYVTALVINRLAEHQAGAMIDRIIGNRLLSASIRHDIIERTDGIPLFLEEMTKAVLEAESETAAERAVAAIPSPALAVPASLHASLMARLDRLGGPAKDLAQIAAAIGREFSHALLASVVNQPDAELRLALDRLIAAAKAQSYFERALTVARAREARSWELRAAMSIARLWRDQGKRDEARDLLAPVYAWFSEGLDMGDLKEAKALLHALAS